MDPVGHDPARSTLHGRNFTCKVQDRRRDDVHWRDIAETWERLQAIETQLGEMGKQDRRRFNAWAALGSAIVGSLIGEVLQQVVPAFLS